MPGKATAIARPNIALVKYWGRRDAALNIPLTNSVSMTLAGLTTRTTVEFAADLDADTLVLNGEDAGKEATERVAQHMDHMRRAASVEQHARVESVNSFPASAGLASSASAFAALTVAAADAMGLERTPEELSALARLGSGSAARSLMGGFVEWEVGGDHESSTAHQLAGEDHWDLHDVVLLVEEGEKDVGSSHGHSLANTSPLLKGRLKAVDTMLPKLREGIQERDLTTVGEVAEADALAMHAVMMTSEPSLLYWAPETVAILQAVRRWRRDGLEAYCTIDAGPNVHVLCEGADVPEVRDRAAKELELSGAQVVDAGPGAGPELVDDHLF